MDLKDWLQAWSWLFPCGDSCDGGDLECGVRYKQDTEQGPGAEEQDTEQEAPQEL